VKRLHLLFLTLLISACGTEPLPTPSAVISGDCSKMTPQAKWGVYPSSMLSGDCGWLPSFWIYTNSEGILDMRGDDCVLDNNYYHLETCNDYTSFTCVHPDSNLHASFHFSTKKNTALENSEQWHGTALISIIEYDAEISCESLYDIKIIRHPNGIISE